tara:strand:- start:89 stop:289 length:201 start_codon:yes stop_codon:yes gene_type:complete
MIETLALLFTYLIGCSTGIYFASQYDKHINKRIKCNNCCDDNIKYCKDKKKENYESFVKKHYKKKK